MYVNEDLMYKNEFSTKSNGGTELMMRGIYERVPRDLLQHFEIIPSRVREINPNKITIYHLHDLPQDPECQHLMSEKSRARFAKIVFCGQWQAQQFRNVLNVPYDNTTVIETAIDPIVVDTTAKFNKQTPVRLIYTSTPQRGLEILVPVVKELAKHFPIHLDVFSSFKIYGWDDADQRYQHVYDEIVAHPNMTYHGARPNEEVREALKRTHIFAYPSIWQECNSRSLIEAMSAGCVCVHPTYAGLADTAGGVTQSYDWVENPIQHANIFYNHLANAVVNVMENNDAVKNYVDFVKLYADNRYNWPRIVSQWTNLLSEVKAQHDRKQV